MYGLLFEQSKRARRVIGQPHGQPLRADGVYLPGGEGPLPPADPRAAGALRFAMIGDSSAAGLGAEGPEHLPGVLIARHLAADADRPVQLDTYAVSGSTTRSMAPQIGLALTNPPDIALIMVGANDVMARIQPRESGELLADSVGRLRKAGIAVVVGTCPDLGCVRPIPQPLRSIARAWALAVARHQRAAVLRAGGHPVPLADLLASEFLSKEEFFSIDQFHPSAAGYEAAAAVLLPAVCAAAGAWEAGALPEPPTRSAAADARRPTARLTEAANRRLERLARRPGLAA
ncbi:MAG TPA: SGNH/GDSL hydrolase family protein [Actinoplanes sp.]|nr:SGNH/GDSL hydrolase family protein [Actinoplanes sp.]